MSAIPVILSGGSGTRLWPLSRKECPKQFLGFDGENTFFQKTILRCASGEFDPLPIVVASDDHRFLVAENLQKIACSAEILLEPVPRNSCAAVIAGCLQAMKRDPDAIVLVMAADHVIENVDGFLDTCRTALPAVEAGYLVTFGVVPECPATGYGYIQYAPEQIIRNCFAVERFIEKPDLKNAEKFLDAGYLWNSGNFMFSAKSLLQEARRFVPSIVDAVSLAHENLCADLDFLRLEERAFKSAESISIDYAIMEKTNKAAVVPVQHDWSDIGNWQSVREQFSAGGDSNIIVGDGLVRAGQNNLVHSEHALTVLNGVSDLVVVTTPDAVLVSSQDSSQEIGDLVRELQQSGRPEATASKKVHRPWGSYDVIDVGPRYKVKRLEIRPGGVLSLQKHEHRAEHWIVVEGSPEITIGEVRETFEPNQSVYIPANSRHRLANHQKVPAILIEVQTGDYLGEDDIVRLEDLYNRHEE